MNIKDKIDRNNLPQHVAIIMDGNGRWAKGLGKLRIFGHQNGVSAVREAMEGAVELGIPYLTLYAFSTENWNRPKLEVLALMELLVTTLSKEIKTFQDNGIRLNTIGDIDKLPKNCRAKLIESMELTAQNTTCVLTLALSYSSQKEIVDATKEICKQVMQGNLDIDAIDEKVFANHLYTRNMPDPDLLIRTSGEQRISNYLLWQIAYSELSFLPKMWPEFTREDLYECVYNYQQRERRFGKTSEQL
ncbi:isoprenyl transferase [Sphingobacterium spiritivorum]|uniref:Isoprenyl transferase n=1 Tax=Sphingobacterium spiritivorum ATCC 33861 TaxID=525373 RepID=D7VKP6_SPHSI|nr:isoprenyl transferase [Sphingobacterium spiritivorum]EFK58848.1 di-trans,poly-cis-decaprenylcistransferase [Sphingobacterium spiritivorum ATCC 33861]QQT34273.1 isoprenyl transferase [Sphingobacterium spiritivorum]WQD35115.1 isoprenyl transferase [Sphingobacterium spiritivorum]SUI99406.1 Undecaprenyl pyrophosphate synthase [Sphingobacterium spiritivorum]